MENIAWKAIKVRVSNYKKFKSDTHVIARQLRDKYAREPITIEKIVKSTTKRKFTQHNTIDPGLSMPQLRLDTGESRNGSWQAVRTASEKYHYRFSFID